MPTIYNLKGENLSQSLQLISPPSFHLHISHHSPSTILFTANSISLSGRPCLISLEVQTAWTADYAHSLHDSPDCFKFMWRPFGDVPIVQAC